jgi:predicted Zn finger-like uncharacterized protein
MIIVCVNCDKKFNVNSELIPDEGRTIQCGSCNHVWFFNKNDQILKKIQKPKPKNDKSPLKPQEIPKIKKTNISSNKSNNKGSEIVEYQPKSAFTFSNFLSYILVGIISIIGFVIILDTFKSSLFVFFPNLEFLLFSFYETLKDVELFVKDLI